MTETTASTDWERARRNLAPEDETQVPGHAARATAFAVDLALMVVAVATFDFVVGLVLSLLAVADLVPAERDLWVRASREVLNHPLVVGAQNVVLALVVAAMPWSWARGGQTPGMAFVGLRIVRSDFRDVDVRTAIVRMVALPFAILSVIGIWWVFVDSKRRSWHDLVAGTVVIAE